MRRLVYCFVLALLISTVSAGQADAGVEWCSEDPVFVVNGNVVDVTTTFPAKFVNSIKGNPAGVDGESGHKALKLALEVGRLVRERLQRFG